MTPWRYDRTLRRVYVFGARVHHGGVGLLLAVVGTALFLHDVHDWPFPLRDPS